MINTQILKGNLIRQDYTTAFTLNQGDKGVPFKIELLENGTSYTLLSTDTVSIEWLKPNRQPFLQDGNIKYGTNYIEITTPEAISQYAGSGTFNIIIADGDVRKGTIRREYKVVATSMTPGSVSEDVITDAMTELRNLNSTLAATISNGNLDNYAKASEVAGKADKTYVDNSITNINVKIEKNATDIATQSTRIDALTSLSSGSTTGDAELIDGRTGANGITYTNIGGAIRGQISNIDDILNDSTVCIDVDLSVAEDGWVRASDGTVITGTDWHHKYLELNIGDTLYLYSNGYDTNVSMIGVYENNKHNNKVTSTQTESDYYTYTATEKCTAYISYKATDPYFCKLAKRVVSISDVEESMLETTRNKFDKDTIKTGYIDATGSLVKTDATLWYSDFIGLDGDFTVSWGANPTDNLLRVSYYDADKNFVKREVIQVNSADKEKYFENTDGYKYIVLSCKYGSENNIQVEDGSIRTRFIEHESAKDYIARDMVKDITEKEYDVCIVGGGAGGIGAAYALKDSGLKVCLIEEQPFLGGTHTQAWVNSLRTTTSPVFLDDVLKDVIRDGQGCLSETEHDPLSVEDSLNADWSKTHKPGATYYHVLVNPRALALKYQKDLSPHIDLYLSNSVIGTEYKNNKIISIKTDTGLKVTANQFIDCSAQDVLLSLSGIELLKGGDSKTRYQDEYGFTEEHGGDDNYSLVNSPTLIYRIVKGTEDLTDVYAAWTDWCAYVYYESNPKRIYINSFNYILDQQGLGNIISENGIDYTYDQLKNRTIQHWKTVKNGSMVGKFPSDTSEYKFSGNAPMLGVRELYRAKCERMLSENDLYKFVTLADTTENSNNLDKFIAVGGGGVDVYGDELLTHENTASMNAKISHYGVPYGCIIPKGFTNVLVASRGFGATHIGLSACRLIKSVMQLGYAAGMATRILNEDEIENYRDVDAKKIQKYVKLQEIVDEL